MKIKGILRDRVYLALALIYAISVAALCLRAPVVQRDIFAQAAPIALADGEFEEAPHRSPDPYAAIATPATSPPQTMRWDDQQPLLVNKHAALWALSPGLSLNLPLFAGEQAELIGLVLIVALAYRFRASLMFWGARLPPFLASRRRGTCVWLGFMVVVVLTLFPPWVQIGPGPSQIRTLRVKLWHAPLFRQPTTANRWAFSDVDYARMFTEIAMGECFVFALYFTWARTKQNSNSQV